MNHERVVRKNMKYQDEFRGCLIGGAIGDALGYPVEFLRAKDIFSRYGSDGVSNYILSSNGKALISDDTQMTLFTATGLASRTNPRYDQRDWWRTLFLCRICL